ncbi:MAG: hypothetical protein IPO48_16395 [Saprospiraceae bacterium]|nr:hypothetical protein [Saprospiraceae bacterium]
MQQETLVLTNSKGKKIPFITHQDEDELLIMAKRGSNDIGSKKVLKIYTLDIDKLNRFKAIDVVGKFQTLTAPNGRPSPVLDVMTQ